jgi:hypothetical protein
VGNGPASRYKPLVSWGERVHRPLMRRSAAGDNRTGRTTSVESRMGPLVKVANEETGRARDGHV